MEIINIIQDSIETSVNIKIFKNINDAMYAHIYKSKLEKIQLKKFINIENFDSERLQVSAVKAYPLNNRPRGKNDITSVKYYQKLIQNNKYIQPIWLIYKNNKYILLDGVHRIVAYYIEQESFINAYIITL